MLLLPDPVRKNTLLQWFANVLQPLEGIFRQQAQTNRVPKLLGTKEQRAQVN